MCVTATPFISFQDDGRSGGRDTLHSEGKADVGS